MAVMSCIAGLAAVACAVAFYIATVERKEAEQKAMEKAMQLHLDSMKNPSDLDTTNDVEMDTSKDMDLEKDLDVV